MQDWINKLDDFLKISDREILTHAGKISHDSAMKLADEEYKKFKQIQINQKSKVEEDFEKAIKTLDKIESEVKKKPKKVKKNEN
jgi:hypothetical protein